LLISLAKTQKKLGNKSAAEGNYIRALDLSAGKEQYLKTIKDGLAGYDSDPAKIAMKKTNELLAKTAAAGK
jgi:hypothetical protein